MSSKTIDWDTLFTFLVRKLLKVSNATQSHDPLLACALMVVLSGMTTLIVA